MRIGIDIDGVIRNIYPKLIEEMKLYGIDTIRPIQEWDNYDISQYFNCNKDMFRRRWFNSSRTYLYSPLYEGASLALINLIEKHAVILISSQPNHKCIKWTAQWLLDNFIPYSELHFTEYSNKAFVLCDAYIDDSPYQWDRITKVWRLYMDKDIKNKVFLFDQPWNQTHSTSNRFYSWKEIGEHFK